MLEAAPTLESLRAPVLERLRSVEETLVSIVESDFGAINEVGEYLLTSRGKLLRPTLLLLADSVEENPSEEAIPLGAVVELMHMATLVHDDAVDHSPRRRGMPTVNSRWTHQVAVIMGDYLYSRALVEVTRMGHLEAVELLARASNRMSIGEMRQLATYDALGAGPEDYFLLCECKTASLMSAACELGALYGAPAHREALAAFGHDLGMAFQITDDLLDYTAPSDVTGKPSGLDLREHKVTLPLIAALERMDGGARARVRALFEDPEPPDEDVAEIVGLVAAHGGLEHARRKASEFAGRARERLGGLPRSAGRRMLEAAVDFVLDRER